MAFSDRFFRRKIRFSLATLGLVGGVASSVGADTGDVVVAEALFRDGKELLAQKDYARACPKLAESYRRDPATGTLLALAMCHEREGKIGSAWAEYADVVSRSKIEARPDREKAARAKATELEPRVSKLTIGVASDFGDLAGLEVRRNGAVVATPLLGTAIPLDGGTQVIEASAPGKKPWRAKVAVSSSGDRQTVTIPELDAQDDAANSPAVARPIAPRLPAPRPAEPPKVEAAKAEPAPVEPPPKKVAEEETGLATALAAPTEVDSKSALTPWQRIGLGTGAAGIVGLGAGGYFAFRAISKNNDSKTGCTGDLCLPKAKQDRLDARSAGNLATIGLIAGGTLTAAGVVMYIVGRRGKAPSAASASLEAIPVAGPDVVGGVLRGSF